MSPADAATRARWHRMQALKFHAAGQRLKARREERLAELAQAEAVLVDQR